MDGKWTITWGDKSWSEDDVTGQHLALVVLTMGGDDDWDAVRPTSGPIRLMAWIAALVSVDSGRDLVEVQGEVSAAPMSKILAAIEVT